jgi:predicted peptidase
MTLAVFRTIQVPVLALCTGLAGFSVSAMAQGLTDPGIHALQFTLQHGTNVDYTLVIPEGYSAATPVPLVLGLHFGGPPQGAGGAVTEILIEPGLRDLGAIIVAPDSVGGNWATPENERAVIALLDMVEANYAIDDTKTLVTGFSMGGSGSWYFGTTFPERFKAAIPIAARPPELAGWRLPVLAIHSRADQVAPFEPAEAAIVALTAQGVNARLIALDTITHYQTYAFADSLEQAIPWIREVWAAP